VSKLKNVKKVIIGLFIILLFLPFFSNNAMSATTIDDTTFPADVGKTYTWKATLPAEAKSAGLKYTFKSESIEKGVHNSIDALVVNCTMRGYNSIFGWDTYLDNEPYMAANYTQNYVYFYDNMYMWAPNIIPTSMNLTFVAEAMYAYNYSIVDNTIIENWGDGDTSEYTYNTKGFLTTYVQKEDGIIVFRLVLATGGDDAIPFGNFFLIFTVISVIALVYLKKQKIR